MHRILMYLIVVVQCNMSAEAQQIVNPSFEGPIGPSRTPPGWIPCGKGSTPDTQPGVWNVHIEPVSGQSYLSLICRGNNVPFSNQWEACGQNLDQPLQKNTCYSFSVDLARSDSFFAGSIFFNKPAVFRLWGALNPCQRVEMLWESPRITNTQWKTYSFIVLPRKHDYSCLILESFYNKSFTYSGNILVENFLIYPDEDPCKPNSIIQVPIGFYGGKNH